MMLKLLETFKGVIQIETAILVHVNTKSYNCCNNEPRSSKLTHCKLDKIPGSFCFNDAFVFRFRVLDSNMCRPKLFSHHGVR